MLAMILPSYAPESSKMQRPLDSEPGRGGLDRPYMLKDGHPRSRNTEQG